MENTLRSWIMTNRGEVTRFFKFAVVGTIGAIVDFGILYLLHIGLDFHLVLANTISFTCAVISNFTWNRYWTYPDSRSKPLTSQLGQFFVVNILGWGINTAILWALESPFSSLASSLPFVMTALQAHKVGYNTAKALATGVVMFWNFFINRLWTYNDV